MPNLNDMITYASPKFVIVRDWRLGAMKYAFMFMVFIKVIVLDLFINCRHLKPHSTKGTGFIDLIPPECAEDDDNCKASYSSVQELKYCARYEGDQEIVTENAQVGDFISPRRPCKYYDENRLIWVPQELSTLFIPLKSVKVWEEANADCDDGETNDEGTATVMDPIRRLRHKSEAADAVTTAAPAKKSGPHSTAARLGCKSKYIEKSREEFYVADIGEFTLEFRHSFESKETGIFGAAAEFQGFFAACASNHVKDPRKECKRMKIPGTSGDVVPEDVQNLADPKDIAPSMGVGPLGGDALMLKDLLKLTPVAQSHHLKRDILDLAMPDRLRTGGNSFRNHGGMLMIEVDYTNFVPMRPGFPVPSFLQWLSAPIKPVTYTYRPFFVPSNTMSRNQVQNSPDGKTRTVETWIGLEIKMSFAGKMVAFDWTEVIAAMTVGLVLMSAATAFVDSVMCFLMPLKDKYNLLKYHASEDFNDAKQLNEFGKKDRKSGSPGSELMLSKLDQDGKVTGALSADESVHMMNSHEIRLNRLDGMCAHSDFNQGGEIDPRWYNYGNFKREYYTAQCGEQNLPKFSDACQGINRKKAAE